VVIHCGKSVQRGPHAANRYDEARKRLAAAGHTALAAQKVVLLEGGFAAFAACPAAAGLIAADADAARPKRGARSDPPDRFVIVIKSL
jgi:hypothetical protein